MSARPPGDELAEVHEKPCHMCRKRKVRCSKTQPCSNCQRADIDCVYDETSRDSVKVPRSTAALAERVAELESLVANMSQQLAAEKESTSSSFGTPALTGPGHGVFVAESIAKRILSVAPQLPANPIGSVQGRLISDDDSSRHIMNAFWASMYDEVRSVFDAIAFPTLSRPR